MNAMKQTTRYVIAFCVAVMISSGFVMLPARAQTNEEPITPEKIELIKTHCESAQTSIQRLQRSDIVTRTNRGRGYENTLRLMAALNSRMALNSLSQPRMTELTSQLQTTFNQFYGHYTEYETNLERSLRINCKDQPVAFYQQLSKVRQLRAQLKKDVDEMGQYIVQYDQLVAELQASRSNEASQPEGQQ